MSNDGHSMIEKRLSTLLLSSLMACTVANAADKTPTTRSATKQSDAPWSELIKPKDGRETETSGYNFKELAEPGRTWQHLNKTQWLVGISLTGGGETLKNIRIFKENDKQNLRDDEISNVKIKSGELFYFYTGAMVAIPHVAFRTQITIGYHVDAIKTNDGTITFSRIPLDIIPTWEFEKHRMGLGITYVFDPKLDTDNIKGIDDVNYSETIGTMIHYQYKFNQRLSIGARYTEVKFSPIGDASVTSNGAHLGLNLEFIL